MNAKLKSYIEKSIFPIYKRNDKGHNLEHIMYVINRSLKFANQVSNIDLDMVYTIAAYHDLAHHIDPKNHEKISAEMLLNDDNLKQYFNNEEIKIMSEAVYDHRASLEYEPRSVYGKIVSSADRNVSINDLLERTYHYLKKNFSNFSLEQIIEDSRKHVIKKFGNNGYALDKMYFKDEEYETFLKEITRLVKDKEAFKQKYIKVNKLENNDF